MLCVGSVTVDESFVQNCMKPTVAVCVGEDIAGTGFIVRSVQDGNDYINSVITCSHVVKDEPCLNVRLTEFGEGNCPIPGKHYPAMVIHTDAVNDVALMIFRSKTKMPTVKIDYTPVKLGDEIVRVGYGLGEEIRFDEGRVTLPEHKRFGSTNLKTNVMTIFGDSGSPIFRDGKVIGIMNRITVCRGVPICQISYAIPIHYIRKLKHLKFI